MAGAATLSPPLATVGAGRAALPSAMAGGGRAGAASPPSASTMAGVKVVCRGEGENLPKLLINVHNVEALVQ